MKTIEESTILELKAYAFDISQQVTLLQNNYKIILQEIQKRIESEKAETKTN